MQARISRLLVVLFAAFCFVGTFQAQTNAPLYLLSYDHGGLILWGPEHFAERLRNGMSWLERYPAFKLGLDNEAYVYDRLAERNPALLEELRADLRRFPGRFGIGTCTYGQPLSTFIDGESNIRQIGYALKTDMERLGVRPPVYLMSEHAMHSQLPQILAGFGFQGAIMRTHFMMYGYNPTFDVPVGWWVGLDGTRIRAVPTYPGEGAEFGRTTLDNWFLTRYPGPQVKMSPEDFRKQFAHIRPLLATRADDSGLRKEELLQETRDRSDYRWVLLEDLSSIFPPPQTEMKTLPNDFTVRMPWGYCGNEIWNGCRQAEVQVETAERLAALEFLQGGTNREPSLSVAWKNLLVAQHHDVQIVGLLPDVRKFLSASLAAATNTISASLEVFARHMKAGGLAQVTVFNPLSWPRREWVTTELTFTRGQAKNLVARHQERDVPSVLLRGDRFSDGHLLDGRLAFLVDVPALTVASYSITAVEEPTAAGEELQVDPRGLQVTTRFYDARLAPGGGLASLIDRRTGANMVEPGKRSGFFAGRIDGNNCESAGKWSLHAPETGAPWVVAREDGFIGSIPYTFELKFPADSPRLDCRVTFNFSGQRIGQLSNDPRDSKSPFVHEQKLRFKIFPGLKPGAVGVRDLPFAVSETTNHYVQGLYWTAVTDSDRGWAFFNRGTMGAVREDDGGFSLPLAYAMYYIWGTRMLNGDLSYEFALEPFAGKWSEADLVRKAWAYNFPLVSATGTPGAGNWGETVQPVEISSGTALLSAIYPEQGRVYARLAETAGLGGKTTLKFAASAEPLRTADLLGQAGASVSGQLEFRPWQISTFVAEPR